MLLEFIILEQCPFGLTYTMYDGKVFVFFHMVIRWSIKHKFLQTLRGKQSTYQMNIQCGKIYKNNINVVGKIECNN